MKSSIAIYRIGLAVVFSLILVLSNTVSFAQSKVQVGPFWGQGVRMITGNEEADLGPGYHGGIMIRVPINDQLSIVPSVSVARKGYYKWEFGLWNEDNVIQYNQKLTYLDFYIPIKFQVAGIFNIQTGFQVGLPLEGEIVIDSYNYDQKFKKNIKSELNSVDFGFVVGAGVQFKNGIGLDLIVNQGFIDIYETEPEPYIDPYFNSYAISELDGKNLLTTINVSYLFGYVPKPVKETVK